MHTGIEVICDLAQRLGSVLAASRQPSRLNSTSFAVMRSPSETTLQ
jgi:hypothetical protein